MLIIAIGVALGLLAVYTIWFVVSVFIVVLFVYLNKPKLTKPTQPDYYYR